MGPYEVGNQQRICLAEMGIARLSLLVAGILWVMCWSGHKAYGQRIHLTPMSGVTTVYPNNSIVTRTDIGIGAAALLCTTTYSPCCSSANQDTQWYFPDGGQVPNVNTMPYYRTRSTDLPQSVQLHRNPDGTTTGIFRCDIPDASGDTQSMFVGIYDSGTGAPTAATLVYSETSRSVTCISSGGPATTVTWRKDGDIITTNATYQQTQVVTDTTTGTYETVLTIAQSVTDIFGAYSCTVENTRGSSETMAPTPPQMFQITAVTTNTLSFSWQEPANPNDITRYEISCKPLLLGIPMPQNHTTGSTDRMTVLTDLLPGVRYNCSIGARNGAGLSTLVYADVTTMEIAMVRVKVVNATALLVSWDAVSSTQHYTFYYSAFSPELFKVVDELTIVVPSTRTSVVVAIRELTAGVEHQFQVTVSLEVQGEVYESKKSILTKIEFDEAAFHLQMGPVSPCTTWSTDKAETIRNYIHSGIAKAISYHCNCSFPVEFIRDGLFRCWKAPDEFSYRSSIVGTEAHNATELVQFLEEWVNSEPVLKVEQFELWVGTTCPVSISSVRLRGEGKCL